MSRQSRNKHKKQDPSQLPPPDKTVGYTLDTEKELFIAYTEDILINQIRRDTSKITDSFDKLCDDHLREISRVFSTVFMLLHRGIKRSSREGLGLEQACAEMLMNTLNSFVAATTVLRNGFRLQPGILIRSILEGLSTVLHVFTNPDDLKDFKEGRLQSSKTIPSAKKVLPPFGWHYGFFSKNFAHIGYLHQELQPLKPYETFDDALEVNISFLRLTVWLLYVTTELVCLEVVVTPRYWRYLGQNERGEKMYAYSPSEDERKWLAKFLGAIISDDKS
jgi:hypothetical protein